MALTLGNVLLELVSASGGVGLEGEVVIRHLLVVTLDGLEELVSGTLNTLGDLDEHGALGGSKVLTSTVRSLLVVTDHTSEASEERLSLTVVGGHSVGEGGQTSTELTLGAVERGAGAGRVGGDASGVALVHHHVLALDASELAVELLGGTSEILGGILGIAGSLGAHGVDRTAGGTGKSLNLSGGGLLVLIKELAELATSTDGRGATVVGELGDALKLTIGATVDTHLGGTVGDDLARDDGDLTRETSLLVLDLGGHTHHSGGERPAGGSNLVASLGASSGDVAHGVREASISEGSLLGETV